jgi:epsilon-lactone hydrolase
MLRLNILIAAVLLALGIQASAADSNRLKGIAELGALCGVPQVGMFGDVTTVISGSTIYYKTGDGPWKKSIFAQNGAHSLTRMRSGKWLIGDTDNNRVVQVDDLSGSGKVVIRSELAGIALSRPHDEIADPNTGDAYVIDGNQNLFRFRDLEGPIEVWTFKPAELGYDRSMSWFDGHLHVIDSSRGEVLRIDDYAQHRFTGFRSPRPKNPVAKPYSEYGDFPAGALSTTGLVLNDVEKAGDWYYGSNDFLVEFAFGGDVAPARLIRWRNWDDFERGKWEDLSALIPEAEIPSAPYFLTIHDNILSTPLTSWRGDTCEDGGILQVDLASLTSTVAGVRRNSLTAKIDKDGTVHIPAIDVPYSDLASPEAKKHFIETMRGRGLIKDERNQDENKNQEPERPLDTAEIRRQRRVLDDQMVPALARLRGIFPVDIQHEVIGGVPTDVILPKGATLSSSKNRVLLNLHGGGMRVGGGLGGQVESVPIASRSATRVIAVDYRMAPESHFPDASEDVANVYRELLKSYRAENIGIIGCSSGAVLTAQAVAWFQAHGLPRPGAIALIGEGAMSDTRFGDSNYVAAPVGGYPVRAVYPEMLPKGIDYVEGAVATAPLVSPAYHPDVLKEFPPSLLLSGTRDVGLSTVLYTHAQLVDAGVDAELHVWEGMYHCAPVASEIDPDVPETRQAWKVMVEFFDKHLGR